MTPDVLATAFMTGRFVAPSGALVPSRVEITRKSLLLFTPLLVLKLKRPRLVDGYDQTVDSVRVAMAARERWFGRKLNQGVYLDDIVLVPDLESDQVLVQAPDDEGVGGEPVVLMRRMPDEQRADALLQSHGSRHVLKHLEERVLQLARFHGDSEYYTDPPFGDPTLPGQRFADLVSTLEPMLDPREHSRLLDETGGWLDKLASTFAHRVYERRIRTCHGAVRLEHLFLPLEEFMPGPSGMGALIDPNDGPDEERAIDTAQELMSLVLELDFLVGFKAGERLVALYAGETHDASMHKVARFYKRLAALKRAVEALAEADGADTADSELEVRARFFIDLALAI